MDLAPFDFLHVQGTNIVNSGGQRVTLRGYCLGGWMNMECFIAGYPGHETGLRAAVAHVLGIEKAEFFFDRFLNYFFSMDDLSFIKSLGCNVVRVALNYKHFETDDHPFEYRPEGFARLDTIIQWARKLQMYIILDLHAAPGCQNAGWHSDNPGGEPRFWGQKVFEDRLVGLWQEFARRYRDEPVIAGYNVMNEPDTDKIAWLNQFYRRVTQAIREIDAQHILFLEGNQYSKQFEQLEPPFDGNTVYSSHNYIEPMDAAYPRQENQLKIDRNWLTQQYEQRVAFQHQYQVPNWVGEFGCIFEEASRSESNIRIMKDMIEIIEEHGHHWTIWTYKDIGLMGTILVDPESEWMRRTRPVRQAKTQLRCDSWIERKATPINGLVRQIAEFACTTQSSLSVAQIETKLAAAVQDAALSQALLPAFAEQFRGMTETEIDRMMQSFAFENCLQRTELVQMIQKNH